MTSGERRVMSASFLCGHRPVRITPWVIQAPPLVSGGIARIAQGAKSVSSTVIMLVAPQTVVWNYPGLLLPPPRSDMLRRTRVSQLGSIPKSKRLRVAGRTKRLLSAPVFKKAAARTVEPMTCQRVRDTGGRNVAGGSAAGVRMLSLGGHEDFLYMYLYKSCYYSINVYT
jgi:hypothetical protein